jgi:hypothetical protein
MTQTQEAAPPATRMEIHRAKMRAKKASRAFVAPGFAPTSQITRLGNRGSDNKRDLRPPVSKNNDPSYRKIRPPVTETSPAKPRARAAKKVKTAVAS